MAFASKKLYAILMGSEEGKDILEGIAEKSQEEFEKEVDAFFGEGGKGASQNADYKKVKEDVGSSKDEMFDSDLEEEIKKVSKDYDISEEKIKKALKKLDEQGKRMKDVMFFKKVYFDSKLEKVPPELLVNLNNSFRDRLYIQKKYGVDITDVTSNQGYTISGKKENLERLSKDYGLKQKIVDSEIEKILADDNKTEDEDEDKFKPTKENNYDKGIDKVRDEKFGKYVDKIKKNEKLKILSQMPNSEITSVLEELSKILKE